MPTPNPATGMAADSVASISSTVPTRTGYTFKSWCKGVVSNNGTICAGIELSSGETVDLSPESGVEAEITLTAVWKLYIQDVKASSCTTEYMAVYDNRDEQSYIIQRLADGKCWMMTNLNLGAVPLTQNLTSSNTNLSSTVAASTFNGWEKTSGSGSYTSAEYIVLTGSDPYNGLPYGTLYNYCATSAHTICTDANSNTSDGVYSICPKGWRLPTGGSSGEFHTLSNKYGNDIARIRASYEDGGAAFTFAGYFRSAAPANQGGGGYYWSYTRRNPADMYHLDLNSQKPLPDNLAARTDGNAIRCVFK